VEWLERIVTIAVPDSEWAGSETITFIATDPIGLSDTASAVFTVNAINDPPKLASLQNYGIDEDDTLRLNISYLQSLVTDPDNAKDEMQFEVTNLIKLDWRFNNIANTINIFARKPNWYGSETVTLLVNDGSDGMDTQPFNVNIRSIPDAPLPFYVISPNNETFNYIPSSINFIWQRAIDPDAEDIVTYNLDISDFYDFSHVFDSFAKITDTVKTYEPSNEMQDGIYYWRVKATDNNGKFTYSDKGAFNIDRIGIADGLENGIPKDYALIQNYPNPFNPSTNITYHLPKEEYVEISIFNSLGQRIRTLVSGEKKAGIYFISWDGHDENGILMSSGIYIYQLKAGDHLLSRKMLLLQ